MIKMIKMIKMIIKSKWNTNENAVAVLDLVKGMIDLNDYLPIELLFVDFVCLMFDAAAIHLLVNLCVETFSAFVVYLIDSTLIIFYANAAKFDFLLPGYNLLKKNK